MGCKVIIQSWSLPKLIFAFFYLFIVYCFLCFSTFAFFLSKFLSFFGFRLNPFLDHISSGSQPSKNFDGSNSNDATKLMYENSTSIRTKRIDNGVDENTIRILEQALEEQQLSRYALLSELEQERLASATATDEAMAMISRLQEEKSAIQIEARQFQRILEEKSAYDSEEMDMLKEIIVKREQEKHCLEKEVEEYRKLFELRNEKRSNHTQEHEDNPFLDPNVDPMLILKKLSESIDKRQTFSVSESKESSISFWDDKSTTINELESMCSSIISDDQKSDDYDDEIHQDIQEKGVLSLNDVPCSKIDAMTSDFDEPRVHDIHIIDPSCNSCKNKDVIRENEFPILATNCDGFIDNGSSSDKMECFATRSNCVEGSFVSEMENDSLLEVDNEREKIESEIGRLRERLKVVNEERKRHTLDFPPTSIL